MACHAFTWTPRFSTLILGGKRGGTVNCFCVFDFLVLSIFQIFWIVIVKLFPVVMLFCFSHVSAPRFFNLFRHFVFSISVFRFSRYLKSLQYSFHLLTKRVLGAFRFTRHDDAIFSQMIFGHTEHRWYLGRNAKPLERTARKEHSFCKKPTTASLQTYSDLPHRRKKANNCVSANLQ